jgi:two-component sensor histidine kinase
MKRRLQTIWRARRVTDGTQGLAGPRAVSRLPARDPLLSVTRPSSQALLAAALTLVAAFAKVALAAVDPMVVPAAVYFPAIVAAALLGGWRCGLVALLLCFCANLGVFGHIFAAGTSARPLNMILFFAVSGGAIAVAHWLGTLVVRLRESRERLAARTLNYETLFETITEGFAVCEAIRDAAGKLVDYRVLEMNPALREMYKIGPEGIGGRMSDTPGDWNAWFALCDVVLTTGAPATFHGLDPRDGRWREVRVSRLTSDRMAQFFIDITARKAEEARQAALFDELNHRVKNNLAIVSSVLSMQARTVEPAAAEALRKAVGRVHSIADLHASLYKSHRREDVDLGLYLDELCASLRTSLLADDRIRIEVDAPSAIIGADHAVPLGLIVSELVTNAVKYAYAPDRGGVIAVRLLREGTNDERLVVADDGRGLPDEGERADGLGMGLVRSMVAQLGGELAIRPGPGARFEIVLPKGALKQRGAPP